MNGAFNVEEFKKAVASISYEPWDSAELDKFMEYHKDISKVMLASSHEGIKDFDYIPTKYGMLKATYSAYLPPNTMYFIRRPDNMLDPFKPDFDRVL